MSEMWTWLQYLVLTLDLDFGPTSDFISSFFDAIKVALMRTSYFLILVCNGSLRISLLSIPFRSIYYIRTFIHELNHPSFNIG